jgi:quercetin dioxygenase-like cupin family protein
MKDFETLRAYAKGKRLPSVIYLGNTKTDWIDYAIQTSIATPDSTDYSVVNRTDVPGAQEYDYSKLGNYVQKNVFEEMALDDTLNNFEGIFNIRFAVLDSDKSVPEHVDSPWDYRLLCVLTGTHNFIADNKTTPMFPGEMYFVNGCYRHTVTNNTNKERIAFLAKMPITEKNTNELLRART